MAVFISLIYNAYMDFAKCFMNTIFKYLYEGGLLITMLVIYANQGVINPWFLIALALFMISSKTSLPTVLLVGTVLAYFIHGISGAFVLMLVLFCISIVIGQLLKWVCRVLSPGRDIPTIPRMPGPSSLRVANDRRWPG